MSLFGEGKRFVQGFLRVPLEVQGIFFAVNNKEFSPLEHCQVRLCYRAQINPAETSQKTTTPSNNINALLIIHFFCVILEAKNELKSSKLLLCSRYLQCQMIEIVSFFPAFLSDKRGLLFSLKDLLFIYLFICTVIYASGFLLFSLKQTYCIFFLLLACIVFYWVKTTFSLQNVSK